MKSQTYFLTVLKTTRLLSDKASAELKKLGISAKFSFDTYYSGYVAKNTSGALKLRLHLDDQYTGYELNERNRSIEEELKALIPDELRSVNFVFRVKHLEHGSCRTFVAPDLEWFEVD